MNGRTDWNRLVKDAVREFAPEPEPEEPPRTVNIPIREKRTQRPTHGRLLFGVTVQALLLVCWLASKDDAWLKASSLWWLGYGLFIFVFDDGK